MARCLPPPLSKSKSVKIYQKVSFLNQEKFIRLTGLLFKKVREIYQNIKNGKNLGACLLKLQKNAL